MATTFPSMVEWIEQTGWEQLHMAHRDENDLSGCYRTFDHFVQDLYASAEQDWNEDMFHHNKLISYEMDLEQDMCMESAKFVLAKIINNAICKGNVGSIVVNEELGPDYETSLLIVNDFLYQLIPAVDRMLKEFK